MADLGTVRLHRTLRTRTTFCGPRMRYLALVIFDVESGGLFGGYSPGRPEHRTVSVLELPIFSFRMDHVLISLTILTGIPYPRLTLK
jgi:hypothetical protein